MTIPRLHLDLALVKEAVRSGAELREGVTVHGPSMQDGRVVGLSVGTGGRREEVRARAVVAADGGHSVLARALGLSTPARWPVRLGLVAHYAGPARLPGAGGAMVVGTGGYCGLAPLPGGTTNVGLVVRADALQRTCLSASAFMARWIENDPHLSDMVAGCELTGRVRGTAPVGGRITRPGAPGMLLVGDSAGFFDPFTGEGIHRAVRGAEIAAQIVFDALHVGELQTRDVRQYARARSRAFGRKQYVTALVQLFVQFPHLMEYALPRLAARPASLDTLGTVLGDLGDAGAFLRPAALWGALRP